MADLRDEGVLPFESSFSRREPGGSVGEEAASQARPTHPHCLPGRGKVPTHPSSFQRAGSVARVPTRLHPPVVELPAAAATSAAATEAGPGVGGLPGHPGDSEAWEEGRSEVQLFVCCDVGREQPRCQGPSGCGESFSPSDVATLLS